MFTLAPCVVAMRNFGKIPLQVVADVVVDFLRRFVFRSTWFGPLQDVTGRIRDVLTVRSRIKGYRLVFFPLRFGARELHLCTGLLCQGVIGLDFIGKVISYEVEGDLYRFI